MKNPKVSSGLSMEGGWKRKQEDGRHEDQENPRNNNARNFFCYLRPQPWLNNGESYDKNQIINPLKGTPTLGLALDISTSMINQLELSLSQASQKNGHQAQGLGISLHPLKSRSKATSIHALSLKVGIWEWKSNNPEDLTAKFYYGTKKLVWEVLCGSLKKKIQIRWSQISAINAYVDGNQTSRLEIELKEQPKLYEEINFNPKSRTQWENAVQDFTGDQTRICRRHTITFARGVLNDPFKTLLKCDNRLANLIQQPFPYQNSPFFQEHMPATVLKSPSVTPLTQTRELDNILPNQEMDSWILDDQVLLLELLEMYKMINFKTNPIDQCDEIKPTTANNNGTVFDEHNSCLPIEANNSCLPVEASAGMADSFIQVNNHSAYVDDEMFDVDDLFTDADDCGELFVFQNSNSD